MLHAIRSALGPVARVGKEITYLPTCPSTNDLLKAMAEAGAGEGTVLVAGEQTRGKGRLGRSFTSAAGKGVYLSALLRPDLDPEKLLPLMGFTAEAMGRAVQRIAGAEAGIKWVNDLILNGKKICGILTESAFSAGGQLQYVVVGIGLNVNYETEDFPPELRDLAGSLKTETGKSYPLPNLAAAMIEELDRLYDALLRGDVAPLPRGVSAALRDPSPGGAADPKRHLYPGLRPGRGRSVGAPGPLPRRHRDHRPLRGSLRPGPHRLRGVSYSSSSSVSAMSSREKWRDGSSL